MLSESHPLIRRSIRFLLLPYCYVNLIDWQECTKAKWRVALDLLYIFFVLRDFPDNYGPCRLWEKPRREWPYYYGSNYNPYQRHLLRKEVQPYDLEVIFKNKEVSDTLCAGLGIPVPKTLGTLDPSDSAKEKLEELLKQAHGGKAIVKPVFGHAGLGIVLAESTATGIRVHHKGRSEGVESFVPPERCLVQEVVVQDPVIAEIAPASVNTLRMMTMLRRSGEAIVIGASMRFSVGSSFVDNWSAGGVAVGVDHENGELKKWGFDKRGNMYTHHPVSDIEFSGFSIPRWSEAVGLGLRVQQALPFVKILGLDLAFTEDGVVLIEINSDADFVFQEQTTGPLLASRNTWRAFREYGLLYNSKQESLFPR